MCRGQRWGGWVGSESLWQDADKELMGGGGANAPDAELQAARTGEGSPGDPAGGCLTSAQGKEPCLRGARSLEGWRVPRGWLPRGSHRCLVGGDSPAHTISEAHF